MLRFFIKYLQTIRYFGTKLQVFDSTFHFDMIYANHISSQRYISTSKTSKNVCSVNEKKIVEIFLILCNQLSKYVLIVLVYAICKTFDNFCKTILS